MATESKPVTIRVTEAELIQLHNLLGRKGISTKSLTTDGKLIRCVITEILNGVLG
jgi:hypothetical protein